MTSKQEKTTPVGKYRRHDKPQDHSSKPICHFYQQGTCRRGNNCRFRHEGADTNRDLTNNANPLSSVNSPQDKAALVEKQRNFRQMKHAATTLAKALQDAEPRPWATIEGPFYSIDIECIASTGYGHTSTGPNSHRMPGRVAMVDHEGNTLVDEILFLSEETVHVTSYLTQLTGLTRELCSNAANPTLDHVAARVRGLLPSNAVLVGQSIDHDIEWLGLEKGRDFRDLVDIQEIFRNRVPPKSGLHKFASASLRWYEQVSSDTTQSNEERMYQELVKVAAERLQDALKTMGESRKLFAAAHSDSPARGSALTESESSDEKEGDQCELSCFYRGFSLRHTCLHLLQTDIQDSFHNPVHDAKYSMMLFQKYRSSPVGMLRAVRDSMMRAPPTPSFSSLYHAIDGVALGKTSYRYKHAARFIWRWWIEWSARRGLE